MFFFLLLIPGFVFAQAIPTGTVITDDQSLVFFQSIAGFLIAAGAVLATITIIVAGFMYMLAGSNTQRLTTAKSMFKAGIIGALIIFSTGIVINTLIDFGSNPLGFFGGGGGGKTCQGGLRVGQTCTSSSNCPNDLVCGGAGEPLCSYSFCY